MVYFGVSFFVRIKRNFCNIANIKEGIGKVKKEALEKIV